MSANTNFNYVIYKHYSEQIAIQNNIVNNIQDIKNMNNSVIPKQDQEKIEINNNKLDTITSLAMPCILL